MLFFSQPAGVQDFFFNLQTLARFFFSKMTMPSFGLVLLDCFNRANVFCCSVPTEHVCFKYIFFILIEIFY